LLDTCSLIGNGLWLCMRRQNRGAMGAERETLHGLLALIRATLKIRIRQNNGQESRITELVIDQSLSDFQAMGPWTKTVPRRISSI
jgi:hypothetical protein